MGPEGQKFLFSFLLLSPDHPQTKLKPELSTNRLLTLMMRCDPTQTFSTARYPCDPTKWNIDLGVRVGTSETVDLNDIADHTISHLH